MKIKEALVLAEKLITKKQRTDMEEALVVLSQGYKIRNKITNKPNTLSQQSVNEFFELIDSNGIHTNWELISIKNVRSYFMEVFKGFYKIPLFPFISDEVKKIRETIN